MMTTMRFLFGTVLSIAIGTMLGCGGGGGARTMTDAPTILTQPASQTAPLGSSATFSVGAIGTAPLSYRWSVNGVSIAGAMGSSYTTAPVALADGGAKYTVVVANTAGSAPSKEALLSIGPRSPRAGDLRFQQVGSAITEKGYGQVGTSIHTYLLGRLGFEDTNYYGSPLSIAGNCYGAGNPLNCLYALDIHPLTTDVPNLNTNYQSDFLHSLNGNLSAIVSADTVVNSMILEPANDDAAIRWVQSPPTTGFSYGRQTVSAANLQSFAMQEGALGRVITAASFNAAGDVDCITYGWQGDSAAVYDAKVVMSTLGSVADDAAGLAAEGYIITTLGAGNDSPVGLPMNGFVLIGTKVQGDSLPREFKTSILGANVKTDLWDPGYAIVGYVIDPVTFDPLYLGER